MQEIFLVNSSIENVKKIHKLSKIKSAQESSKIYTLHSKVLLQNEGTESLPPTVSGKMKYSDKIITSTVKEVNGDGELIFENCVFQKPLEKINADKVTIDTYSFYNIDIVANTLVVQYGGGHYRNDAIPGKAIALKTCLFDGISDKELHVYFTDDGGRLAIAINKENNQEFAPKILLSQKATLLPTPLGITKLHQYSFLPVDSPLSIKMYVAFQINANSEIHFHTQRSDVPLVVIGANDPITNCYLYQPEVRFCKVLLGHAIIHAVDVNESKVIFDSDSSAKILELTSSLLSAEVGQAPYLYLTLDEKSISTIKYNKPPVISNVIIKCIIQTPTRKDLAQLMSKPLQFIYWSNSVSTASIKVVGDRYIHGFTSDKTCFAITTNEEGCFMNWVNDIATIPLYYSTCQKENFQLVSENELIKLAQEYTEDCDLLNFYICNDFQSNIDLTKQKSQSITIYSDYQFVISISGSVSVPKLLIKNLKIQNPSTFKIISPSVTLQNVKFLSPQSIKPDSSILYNLEGDLSSLSVFSGFNMIAFISDSLVDTTFEYGTGSVTIITEVLKFNIPKREAASNRVNVVTESTYTFTTTSDCTSVNLGLIQFTNNQSPGPINIIFEKSNFEKAEFVGKFIFIQVTKANVLAKDFLLFPPLEIPSTVLIEATGAIRAGYKEKFTAKNPFNFKFTESSSKKVLIFDSISFEGNESVPPDLKIQQMAIIARTIIISGLETKFKLMPRSNLQLKKVNKDFSVSLYDEGPHSIDIFYNLGHFPTITSVGNGFANLTLWMDDDDPDQEAYSIFFSKPQKAVNGLQAEAAFAWGNHTRMISDARQFSSDSPGFQLAIWPKEIISKELTEVVISNKDIAPVAPTTPTSSPSPTEEPKDEQSFLTKYMMIIVVASPAVTAILVIVTLRLGGCIGGAKKRGGRPISVSQEDSVLSIDDFPTIRTDPNEYTFLNITNQRQPAFV